MKLFQVSLFISITFILLSGCTFEDPNTSSPTYKKKTTTTETTTSTSKTTATTKTVTSTTGTGTTVSTSSVTTTTIYGTVIYIKAEDNEFTPDEVSLELDEKVTFLLENLDGRTHLLRNEDLQINWQMFPKTNRTREYTPKKKGTYLLESDREGINVKVTIE